MMRAMRTRTGFIVALIVTLAILSVAVVRMGQEKPIAEGMLFFTLETRLPDHAFAGIRDRIRMGTGRGIWRLSLGSPPQQAELMQPCRSEPWVTSTDSSTHIAFGCGTDGILYESPTAQRLRLKIPSGERLIALSLSGNYAIFVADKVVLLRNYKIAGGQIFWTSREVLSSVPPVQSILFAPHGTAILMESSGWVYLLPAVGQEARKVIKGRAVGWMQDSQHFLVYDERRNELVKYAVGSEPDALETTRLEAGERPVAISPSGEYVLLIGVRPDLKRFLFEVQVFRIRKMDEWQHVRDVDAGWGVGMVHWLLK